MAPEAIDPGLLCHTGTMDPTRTFVSLPMPPGVRRAIEDLRVRHAAAGPSGWRWPAGHQAHLTMAFLGDLDEAALMRARACARRAARRASPFEADLRGAGAFPSAARARVVWLGWGAGAAEVGGLHAQLARELEATGFELDRRRFHPHVTLARARAPLDARPLLDALTPWRSAAWRVAAIELMASRLTPAGAVHTRLERCELGGGANGPAAGERPPRASAQDPDVT